MTFLNMPKSPVHSEPEIFQTVDKVPALPGFSIVYTVFLV